MSFMRIRVGGGVKMNAYVYAPISKRFGTGHRIRAEKHQSSTGDFIVSMWHTKFLKRADTIYVDVKNCPFMLAWWLRSCCRKLIFIDDFGLGARWFGDETRVYIPHWKEGGNKILHSHKGPMRIRVYIYTGGLDPHGVALKLLASMKEGPYQFDIQIGSAFKESYKHELMRFCVRNSLDFRFIGPDLIDSIFLREYDLIYMTWGIHYLNNCKTRPIIPVSFDRYTRRLIKYYSGVNRV